MVNKLNGIFYPATLNGVLSDTQLVKPFNQYLKRKMMDGELRFLLSKKKLQYVFENYMHAKAPVKLNISSQLRTEIDTVFKDEKWKDKKSVKAYTKCLNDVRDDVERTITTDHLTGRTYTFWGSEEFNEVHKKNLRKEIKLGSKQLKMLGFTNVTDKRIGKMLMEVCLHFACYERTAAKKIYKKIQKLEPADSVANQVAPEKAEEFLKKMKLI